VTDDKPSKKVADQYDRGYDYTKYWDNRDYEHAAEEIAIRRLLDGRHFGRAADVGGDDGEPMEHAFEHHHAEGLVPARHHQHVGGGGRRVGRLSA
jgi:hypothetical protein